MSCTYCIAAGEVKGYERDFFFPLRFSCIFITMDLSFVFTQIFVLYRGKEMVCMLSHRAAATSSLLFTEFCVSKCLFSDKNINNTQQIFHTL